MGEPSPGAEANARADFAVDDSGARRELVAMMDATDAWPAVRAARAWVLDRTGVGPDTLVIDVGCGPGTFGAAAAARSAVSIDVDRSVSMLTEATRRYPASRPALAEVRALPFRDGSGDVVRTERVLQWTTDPRVALAELWRVVAPSAWIAVTDTDWGTFAIDHPDPGANERFGAAALRWVPHPRFAGDLSRGLSDLGAATLIERADTVVISAWDPDDPAQHDGPPGLPLRSIAACGRSRDRAALEHDLDVLADRARRGHFSATLTLITVAARRRLGP